MKRCNLRQEVVTQPEKEKVSRSAKDSVRGSLFDKEIKGKSKQLLSNYNPHRHGSEVSVIYNSQIFLTYIPKNDKLVSAVPPPLFRGEASVVVL